VIRFSQTCFFLRLKAVRVRLSICRPYAYTRLNGSHTNINTHFTCCFDYVCVK
jgi:hypothetical protein